MPSLASLMIVIPSLLAPVALLGFLAYIWIRYSPIVGRIFEETPVMLPLRAEADPDEEVRFTTPDGLSLAGTYYHASTPARIGVIVFCHEYLGDRWSARAYADGLREMGFDLFTFDFRNHGDSDAEPGLKPLQWVSDREITDVRAALDYLDSRPDHDPAGVGLFGISRGGGTALCAAANNPRVWGVVTDSAFPTHGTMYSYVNRWAEIYVGSKRAWRHMPRFILSFVAWSGRMRAQIKLGMRFPSVERAVARLAPRPWLAIHGEKDAYIGAEIARELLSWSGDPKELWVVPGAKHNRAREVAPEEYRNRLETFFRRFAPRRLAMSSPSPDREAPPSRTRRSPVVAVGEPVHAAD